MKISRKSFLKTVAATAAGAAAMSLTGCGDKGGSGSGAEAGYRQVDLENYAEESAQLYNAQFEDFMALYEDASAERVDNAKRFAEMAKAEAKLMQAGVMIPTTCQGGNYAIGCVAPYTITSTMWGTDEYRYHSALITNETILAADRDEMKAKWNETRGDGNYLAWAKEYLTGKGYTLKDSYSLGYTSDPTTWDVMNTYRVVDLEPALNSYDGLLEYDCENVQRPALAESYEVSDDGLTYTFHIRQGAVWVDNQGREIANVTAHDFVDGMQHLCDAQGGLEYLVQGIIVNVSEYIAGTVTDFSEVGVTAEDDYTLVYTLEDRCPYFLTMLSYSVFAPLCRTFYESRGGKFGAEFDASAADYVYGTSIDNIAYCGPYLCTNWTEKNTLVFKANESYWNAANMSIKQVTWLYNDGSDSHKGYNDFKAGVLDGTGLNSEALQDAYADNMHDYVYTSLTDASAFNFFLNLNRYAFENFNDGAAKSPQTPEQAERTHEAMQNVHFRRALSMSIERGTWNAQTVGEDLKYVRLINSYTPGNFVSLPEETTVDINGTSKTYPAGTYYGEIMQDQITADGSPLKVWDAEQESSAGFDGWYHPTEAAEELAAAIEELGMEITAENPIYIDLPYPSVSTTYTNAAAVAKKSIEDTLGGAVIVNTIDALDQVTWGNCGYYADAGYQGNYDLYNDSGWGPDYGDPSTYLDTFLVDGSMIKMCGIN